MKKLNSKDIFFLQKSLDTQINKLQAIINQYETIPDGTTLSNLIHIEYQVAKDDIKSYKELKLKIK